MSIISDPAERIALMKNAVVASTQDTWHMLHNVIKGDETIEELEKLGGLDWKVQLRTVRMAFAQPTERNSDKPLSQMTDIEMSAYRDNAPTMIIPDYRFVVRSDNNKVFQVASKGYKIHQNNEIVSFFKKYVEASHMTIETLGSLKGGAVIWCMATITPEGEKVCGEKVKRNLLLSTSHDGSLPTCGYWTDVFVVCQNTLRASMKDRRGGFRLKHYSKFDESQIKKAEDRLQLGQQLFAEKTEKLEMLQSIPVDYNSQLVKEYIIRLTQPELLNEIISKGERLDTPQTSNVSALDAILGVTEEQSKLAKVHKITEDDLNRVGKNILDSILTGVGQQNENRRNTWFGVLNGVTNYTDNVASRSQDTRTYNAWYGKAAELKENAFDLAVELAQATK